MVSSIWQLLYLNSGLMKKMGATSNNDQLNLLNFGEFSISHLIQGAIIILHLRTNFGKLNHEMKTR